MHLEKERGKRRENAAKRRKGRERERGGKKREEVRLRPKQEIEYSHLARKFACEWLQIGILCWDEESIEGVDVASLVVIDAEVGRVREGGSYSRSSSKSPNRKSNVFAFGKSMTRKFECEWLQPGKLWGGGGSIEEVDAAGLAVIDTEDGGEDGALCEMLRWRTLGEDGMDMTTGGGCEMRPKLDKKMRTAVRSCCCIMDAPDGDARDERGVAESRFRGETLWGAMKGWLLGGELGCATNLGGCWGVWCCACGWGAS
jgi:hypothetical protein